MVSVKTTIQNIDGRDVVLILEKDQENIPNVYFGSISRNGFVEFYETEQEYNQAKPVFELPPGAKEEKPVTLTEEDLIKLKSILAANLTASETIK